MKWSNPQTLASLVVAAIGLLLSLGILLFVRRLGGAFTADLPRSMLFLTAVFSLAIAASSRVVWRRLFPLRYENGYRFSWGEQFVGWAPSLALILMMMGCCFPGEHLSDWLIWLPLLGIDQFWRQDFFDGGHPEFQAGMPVTDLPAPVRSSLESDASGVSTEPLDSPDCTQQVFRVREPDGQEAIYATLQIDFQAGQRYATAYVGFCPPLSYRPAIEVDPTSGPTAEIKIVQALSHGARLDLKLARAAAGPAQVHVDLAARCPESSDS